jgi:hypothetical protein
MTVPTGEHILIHALATANAERTGRDPGILYALIEGVLLTEPRGWFPPPAYHPTAEQWRRLFEALLPMPSVYVCTSTEDDDTEVGSREIIDATITAVSVASVTITETFDTGQEPPWGTESIDVDTVLPFAAMPHIRLDIYD